MMRRASSGACASRCPSAGRPRTRSTWSCEIPRQRVRSSRAVGPAAVVDEARRPRATPCAWTRRRPSMRSGAGAHRLREQAGACERGLLAALPPGRPPFPPPRSRPSRCGWARAVARLRRGHRHRRARPAHCAKQEDSAEIARERGLVDEYVSVRLLEALAGAERAIAALVRAATRGRPSTGPR